MAKASKKKLLVLQPMVGIGDMVWHKPWLDAIAQHYDMTLMAKPSSHAGAVLADHTNLKIIDLHRSERGKRGRHDGVFGFFRLVAALKSARVDEIWILHRSWRYGAAALLAGIAKRSGYGLGKQSKYLNDDRQLPPSLKSKHPREAVAYFTDQRGIVPKNDQPKIKLTAAEIKAAKTFIANDKPFIICGVGAADIERQWSPERFAGLIKRLGKTHPELQILLCGSPAEERLGQAVQSLLDDTTSKPKMVFDQSLRMVMALHHQAALYIGNDTSLINIAAAVSTPAIRIFASTLPVLNSPLIETVTPSDPKRMDVPGSINDIDDEYVASRANDKLKSLGILS